MKLFMTVDFFDDMISVAWNQKMLRKFMEMNAQMGVKRINWLHHGDKEDGFWKDTGMPWQENFDETFKSMGNSYLKAAVQEAHRVGMEIFAIYKPFDMAIYGHPVKGRVNSGKMPAVGGKLAPAYDYLIENRSILMCRRHIEKIQPAKIILKTAKKLDLTHGFHLWRSDDNRNYCLIEKVVYPEADGLSVVFDISSETAKFFAIESLSEKKVENRIDSIVEVKSSNKKSLQYTLGLEPVKYRIKEQKNHHKTQFDIGEGFSVEGFMFDYLPGIPSAVPAADKCLERVFSLSDNDQNVIGVSLEVNEYVPGAPEPAEPAAVEYWLHIIRKTLDCGVDGIDIRITNHNSILNWAEYGFNQPVVDEYIKRYGINPRLEPFNKEKMRRLRGEFYTAFLEKAGQLVKGADRRFCLHIPDTAFGSPNKSTMMEIHWDWQEWLRKSIPDEITFKTIFTDSVFSQEALSLFKLCHDKEIPISVCPFLHAVPDLSNYLSRVKTLGANAFIVYESATVWKANHDDFEELNPLTNKILLNNYLGHVQDITN